MSDIAIPILNDQNQVDQRFLDLTGIPKLGPNGQLDPAIVPGGSQGGGPQSVDFAFGGTLVLRTGVQYWMTPAWATVKPKRLTATLGTMPTVSADTTPTSFRLLVNGSKLADVRVPSAQRFGVATAFDFASLPGSSLLSVDVIGVPNSTPSRAGDAVVQLWWEYA